MDGWRWDDALPVGLRVIAQRHRAAMDAAPIPEPTPSCERCFAPDAVAIAGRWLCVDCYQVCGSCCPEFSAHDLTQAATETDERTGPGTG